MHQVHCQVPIRGFSSAHLLALCRVSIAALALATTGLAHSQSTDNRIDPQGEAGVNDLRPGTSGAVPLRQPGGNATPSTSSTPERASERRRETQDRREPELEAREPKLPKPSEFEEYVNRLAFPNLLQRPDIPLTIRRLGTGLITDQNRGNETIDFSPLVPPDYLISPGDEIVISIWGSVDAELRLIVDRSGRITLPRVGSIMVSGVRYADLPAVISQRVAQTFKNFQLSVSLGQLRGVRVYVTGFVVRPGAYTVNALSSIANAVVRAGGPSASGSFRDIQLRRGNGLVSTLDFYDLLLKGDRSSDKLVQADDVIHVGPIGAQVGVIGSVNRAAIFELKPGETMADALRMAGGFAAVADTTRMALERVDERATVRVVQVETTQAAETKLRSGDVLRAFNAVTLSTSIERQNKRVRVEGEVLRPGDYVLPAQSTIADALRAAGGLSTGAFVFGTEFTRESVRITQQENFERALRNLENDIALASSTQRVTNADEAAALSGRSAATAQLIARLRTIKPTGRVVLQMPPDSRELPNLMVEDGDRLYRPAGAQQRRRVRQRVQFGQLPARARAQPVGLPEHGRWPERAVPTRAAPSCCAPTAPWSATCRTPAGPVVGCRAASSALPALPGDTLFVPEQLDKTTFVQHAKDWTQILAQFALGVAAFVTLTN